MLRSRRWAPRTALCAAVLLSVAGTGLAASAVTDSRPSSSKDCAPASSVGSAAVVSGEVVAADSFDSGAISSNWTTVGSPKLTVTSDAARSAPYGLRVDLGSESDAVFWKVAEVSSPGTYRLTLNLRTPPGSTKANVPVIVQVQDVGTGAVLAAPSATLTSEWTTMTTLVTPRTVGTVGDCVYNGTFAMPIVVRLLSVPVGCGTIGAFSFEADDLSVSYVGTQTTSPTTTKNVDSVVRPACMPPTSTSTAKTTCKVKVTAPMTWDDGIQLGVVVTNLSKSSLKDWTLTAVVNSSLTAAYAWPWPVQQSGMNLTFEPDSELAARGTARLGLVLTGGVSVPTGWAVNGVRCKS